MSYELTTRTWLSVMRRAVGAPKISPRGMPTQELLHNTTSWEMEYPMILLAERRLNFKFMFAEAYWILSGSNSLEFLTPYCAEIAKFSDNGETLSGAYGVPLMEQAGAVLQKLVDEPDTRQAIITLWKPNFGSKDVPCTVCLQFLIRNGRLDLSVYMRSSDIWLGLPYDVFTFSMIGWWITLNLRHIWDSRSLEVGRLNITAGSQHLYEQNKTRVSECLNAKIDFERIGAIRPMSLYGLNTPDDLMKWLGTRRDNPKIEI